MLMQRRSPATIRQLIAVATAGADVCTHFQGNQAKTNGRDIYLPAMLTPEAEQLAVGFAWHEAFHVEITDFTEAERRLDDIKKRPMLKRLENALEDGRIEREKRVEFPGTHRTINDLIAVLRDRGNTLFSEPQDDAHPANYLLGFVLNWTRKHVNGYSAIMFLDQWRAFLAQVVGEPLVQAIEEILDRNRMLGSTADAFDVAGEILDLVPPKASDKPDKGNSDNSGGGSKDSGQNDGSDQSQGTDDGQDDPPGGEPENSGDPKGDNSGQEGGSSSSNDENPDDDADPHDGGKANSSGGKDGGNSTDQGRRAIAKAGEPDLDQTDLGDIAGEAINKAQQGQPGGKHAGHGSVESVQLPPGIPSAAMYREVAATATALGTRLRGVIQAEMLSQDRHTKRSGRRLDCRRLARVALDDPRIWRKPSQQVDTSGHVHVLLDTSSSMRKQMETLKRVGLATVRAIESVDELSVSASTLPIGGEVRLLKLAEESAVATAGRFDDLVGCGMTPMAQSINAVEALLVSPKENRLLIIFTDGDPDSGRAVEKVITRLGAEHQVRVAAVILGNQKNKLEAMMPTQRITELAELPLVVTDLCAQLVRENLRRVA